MKRLVVDFLILFFLIENIYLWYSSLITWAENVVVEDWYNPIASDEQKEAMRKMGPRRKYYTHIKENTETLYVEVEGKILRLRY